MKLLDSPSALQRMKSRNGYRVSGNVSTSSYILGAKIKRILNTEFTQNEFEEFMASRNYVSNSVVSRDAKIDQFMNRIERVPASSIKKLYDIYESEGVLAMVDNLAKPIKSLIKLGREVEAL